MNPRLLDVLHDPPDHHALPIAERVDVDLDRVLQELVDEDGLRLGALHRFERALHVVGQVGARVHDFHGAPSEHVARPHDHREADPRCDLEGVAHPMRDASVGPVEP